MADFFNLRLWRAGREPSFADVRDGIEELVFACFDALGAQGLTANELLVRLYGGWHDAASGSTTRLCGLTSAVIRKFPRRMGARLRIQLAEAPLAAPQFRIKDTVRLAPARTLGQVKLRPHGCVRPGACSLGDLSSWLRGSCPESNCPVSTEDAVEVKQQKIVDTLITADAIDLANSGDTDILMIATDDDDMLPALLSSVRGGIPVFNLYRRDYSLHRYVSFVEDQGVLVFRW